MPTPPATAGFELPGAWTARSLTSFRKALLTWFDAHRRDLPWRSSRDPYRIWVSEVMLQQTTVAAVVPYFERFLQAFPTIHALAAADEQAVLKLWEGLGYYRRARHLHKAAKRLASDHPDELPDDPTVWAALPGVGRYILGAVLSQAFDRKLPIVEANTLRVLSRLFAYPGDPRTGSGLKWVWAAAERVLPEKRIGDFNQAMMELGALVCTPMAPDCANCPAARVCEAKRLGRQAAIPPPAKRPATVEVREVAVVVRNGGKVLLVQRPADALRGANLWEFPHGELMNDETHEVAALRIVQDLIGLKVKLGTELLTVSHGVTRFAITMTCLEATRTGGRFRSAFYTEGRWVESGELGTFPLSTPQRKLATEIARRGRQRRLC